MHIYHLVFMSRATSPASDALFESIRNCAERHNNANRITGLLLHCAGYFMQVIEGAARDVADTFERVNNDARHTDIQCLHFARASERYYAEWSLGVSEVMRSGRTVTCREMRRVLMPNEGDTPLQLSYDQIVRAFENFRALVTGAAEAPPCPDLDRRTPAELVWA